MRVYCEEMPFHVAVFYWVSVVLWVAAYPLVAPLGVGGVRSFDFDAEGGTNWPHAAGRGN
jgi:hypothetical protein